MKRLKISLAVQMALCLPVGVTHAGELRSELAFLRDTHPLIRANAYAVGASDSRSKAARAGFLPRLTVTGDSGSEKIANTPFSEGTAPGEPIPQTDLKRKKFNIALEQNLFNGGKTLTEVRIAGLDKSIKELEFRATSQDVLLEALIAYLQVVRNRLLIRLAELNEKTTLQQLEMENTRVARGGGVVVDELQAATRLQIVRERKVFYEQGMRDAVTTYEQVFGRPPEPTKLQDLESPMSALPISVEAALEVGLVENPKLKQLRLQMDRSSKLISLERSNFAPKVDLVLSRSNDEKTGGMYKKAENSALIKFSWNLFSGGDSVHRTEAAVFEVKEIGEREASTKRKTAESIRMSWNQYQKGVERLKLLEQASETSRRVMEGRKKLRDAGRESVLAVLDAEVEYYGVLANKVNAMIDARLGSYRLLHAIGLLEFSSLYLDAGEFTLPVRSIDQTLDGLVGQPQPKPQAQPDASLQTPPAVSVPAPVVAEVTQAVVPQVPVLAEASRPLTVPSQESVVSEDPTVAIAELLNQWAQAWSSRDMEAYARFYGDAFKTGPHRSKAAWLKFRQSRIVGRSAIEVSIEDLQVKAIEPNQAEAIFVQNYASGSIKDRSQKTMRLEKTVDGWRIVSEQSAPIKPKAVPLPLATTVPQPVIYIEAQKPVTLEAGSSSIATSAPAQEPQSEIASEDPTGAVTELLNQWAQAWSNRDMEAYGRFYGDAFQSGSYRSKAAWLKFRQSRILGRSAIEVSIEDLQVKPIEANQAEATFVQNYASGSIKDRSQKTMRLEKTTDGWRIVSEKSSPVPRASRPAQTTQAQPLPLPKEWSEAELSELTPQIVLMLDQWSQTFVNKDFDAYAKFYDDRFKTSKFRSKSAWLQYKKPRLIVDQDIQVTIENVRVQPSQADRIKVTFVKRYTSQALKYRAVKTMILAPQQGSWTIVSEV